LDWNVGGGKKFDTFSFMTLSAETAGPGRISARLMMKTKAKEIPKNFFVIVRLPPFKVGVL
jgi:hypothetical protein